MGTPAAATGIRTGSESTACTHAHTGHTVRGETRCVLLSLAGASRVRLNACQDPMKQSEGGERLAMDGASSRTHTGKRVAYPLQSTSFSHACHPCTSR